ncbi:hypothetical protein B0H16DRAFT_1476481 [Mycena metata]|uniref:Uncharacterized protein n=1 Tax=Mycena metata TaxID=1033252 RepID=A0AAD7MGS9_9AGAR|nr:hypothetical protein B0H16DRAFT_1476481 [Mycena metata]
MQKDNDLGTRYGQTDPAPDDWKVLFQRRQRWITGRGVIVRKNGQKHIRIQSFSHCNTAISTHVKFGPQLMPQLGAPTRRKLRQELGHNIGVGVEIVRCSTTYHPTSAPVSVPTRCLNIGVRALGRITDPSGISAMLREPSGIAENSQAYYGTFTYDSE